ncbi:P-II family nitrogen regulator [Acetobacterium carbinolicum]|jgi:nitrogen regulatory protein PII 2|uniref:P-II family nitrogen regulator n=1 Tax=Acetobacterium TaxID=33951 RepID=UPI000DBEC67C|nr:MULTISPECIES: P-II family nitrogen regulator [unclassified Acetobacterium]AWW27816.1 P-II family nitrogen regulator [Acetobacterium sp. KB-1]MDK2941989.1 nitrogen regulatory protein 2 [Acetobacterium sp.]MDZ5726337.1 P-II family nitrogen regulator [Acetobacterium sp. K1/6]
MKEVMAIIRQNKVNQTKEALVKDGYPAFTCLKVLGRGKKTIDLSIVQDIVDAGEMPISPIGESLTESSRLIPKRFFTLIVEDEDVAKVVSIIIDNNQTGNPGDGKIFVIPIEESIRVRSGEKNADAF